MSLLWKGTKTFCFANMNVVYKISGKISLIKAFEKKSERKGFSLFIIMQVCDFWQKDDDFKFFEVWEMTVDCRVLRVGNSKN